MNDTLFIEIQRYCQLVSQHGLREISISRPGFSLSLMSESPRAISPVLGVAPAVSTMPGAVSVPEPPAATIGSAIISPLIGVFYRSPSPDAPPFVEIGDTIEVGQTVGIVEAMKVFNEITAEIAGEVIAIPAENGALVQVDQPLVIIEPM